MVKTILKWCLVIALLAYVFISVAWAREQARQNTVKGIEIEIAKENLTDSVSASGVLMELNRYPVKIVGTQIGKLDTRDITMYLDTMPQFENVRCNITTGGYLKVNVVPMIPAARVFDADRSYYINREGKTMPSKAEYYVDVPVIAGTFTNDFTPKMVLPVVNFVQQDETLSKLVSMIYATDRKNIYLVPRIKGHIINFGDTLDLPTKKEVLLAFYKKVIPYKGWETYDTISVKFKGQIVATRRDKSSHINNYALEEEIDLEEATLPDDL